MTEETVKEQTVKDAERYTYRVQWSPEDGEYVATIAEFPSLSWLATSPSDAIGGAISLVDDVINDLQQSGEPVSEPFAKESSRGSSWFVPARKLTGAWQLRLLSSTFDTLTILRGNGLSRPNSEGSLVRLLSVRDRV